MTEHPNRPFDVSPSPPTPAPRPVLHPLVSVLVFLIVGFVVAQTVGAIPLVVWFVLHFEEMAKVFDTAPPSQIYAELMHRIGGFTLLLSTALGYVPMLVVLVFWRQGIDRKSFLSLGLHWSRSAGRQLCAGLLTGAGAVIGLFAILVLTGDVRVRGWAVSNISFISTVFILLAYLLLFAVQSGAEEIVCRGYLLQTVMEVWKPWVSVTVISLFFGALHLLNPGASVVGFLQNVLIGVVFSLAYLKTRALWFPIGMHIAWNFTLGTVVSLPVSGIETFRLLNVETVGSPLMTGGRYGLEASLLTLIGTVVGCGVGIVWLRANSASEESPTNR
ncbi:MAG: CPBP family intramembrane metalloprotease [Abditibacteriales bacterium]|nr:CPBP family intramembrane metalloprotease [Abditibacteriales bacterium]MDW8367268.1 type II CAAX endopeptidase family protein [Abditibacteriales bacterium]